MADELPTTDRSIWEPKHECLPTITLRLLCRYLTILSGGFVPICQRYQGLTDDRAHFEYSLSWCQVVKDEHTDRELAKHNVKEIVR